MSDLRGAEIGYLAACLDIVADRPELRQYVDELIQDRVSRDITEAELDRMEARVRRYMDRAAQRRAAEMVARELE